MYLIDAKVPDSPLYPKDVKQRALVNQRLYFDAGTLYKRIRDICVSNFATFNTVLVLLVEVGVLTKKTLLPLLKSF